MFGIFLTFLQGIFMFILPRTQCIYNSILLYFSMLDISMFCKRRDKTVRAASWPTLSTMMENIFIIVATVWEPGTRTSSRVHWHDSQPTNIFFRRQVYTVFSGKRVKVEPTRNWVANLQRFHDSACIFGFNKTIVLKCSGFVRSSCLTFYQHEIKFIL